MKNLIKISVLSLAVLLTLTSCDPAGVKDDIFTVPYVMEYTDFDIDNYEVNEVDAESFSGYGVSYDDQNEIIGKNMRNMFSFFHSNGDQVTVVVDETFLSTVEWVYINIEGHYYKVSATDVDNTYSIRVAGLDNITLVDDVVLVIDELSYCDGCPNRALKINF